jgi:hypothetical protein
LNLKDRLFGVTRAQVKTSGIYQGSTQEWLPVADIRDGIVLTKDGRYVKILEVLPVNFYLKSYMEQQSIILRTCLVSLGHLRKPTLCKPCDLQKPCVWRTGILKK